MTPRTYPSLWLFDFDNTLAQLEPVVDWQAARAEVRRVLMRAGAPREITDRTPPRSLAMYEGYRAHLERTAPAHARDERVLRRVSRLIEKYELAAVERADPFEGSLELLRAVAAIGGRAGIVTSNSSVAIDRWLKCQHAADTVGFVVGRDAGLALKPSSAMVLRALDLSGALPRDAVLVGDSEADLRAAAAAQVRFIGIASDDPSRDRLLTCGAEEIYASPAAIAVHLIPASKKPVAPAKRRG